MFKPFLIKLSLGQYCQELPDHLGEGQEGIRSTAYLLIFISAPSTTSQPGAVQSQLPATPGTKFKEREIWGGAAQGCTPLISAFAKPRRENVNFD